jgi:hypothetical protein
LVSQNIMHKKNECNFLKVEETNNSKKEKSQAGVQRTIVKMEYSARV